eukprot:3720839-Prorocentrum_lima.AAC.1
MPLTSLLYIHGMETPEGKQATGHTAKGHTAKRTVPWVEKKKARQQKARHQGPHSTQQHPQCLLATTGQSLGCSKEATGHTIPWKVQLLVVCWQ